MAQNPQAPAAAGSGAGNTVVAGSTTVVSSVEAAAAAKIATAIARVEANEKSRAAKDPLFDGTFAQSYEEIRSLVWAKSDPVFSVALEEWDRKERVLSGRVERREKRSADLINQIFNLVGFYSVFQGVVLTAVSQLTSGGQSQLTSGGQSQCGKVWFPIVLSVVAAAVTFTGVWLKFVTLKELEDSINTERRIQAEAVKRLERLRANGADFRFFRDTLEVNERRPKSFGSNKIGVLVSLIVVTGIFILSYFVILCDLWEIRSLRSGL